MDLFSLTIFFFNTFKSFFKEDENNDINFNEFVTNFEAISHQSSFDIVKKRRLLKMIL